MKIPRFAKAHYLFYENSSVCKTIFCMVILQFAKVYDLLMEILWKLKKFYKKSRETGCTIIGKLTNQ